MDELFLLVNIEIKFELVHCCALETFCCTISVDLVLISWVLSLDIVPNSTKVILDRIEACNIIDWGFN